MSNLQVVNTGSAEDLSTGASPVITSEHQNLQGMQKDDNSDNGVASVETQNTFINAANEINSALTILEAHHQQHKNETNISVPKSAAPAQNQKRSQQFRSSSPNVYVCV